jgi:ribosomal protein S8E
VTQTILSAISTLRTTAVLRQVLAGRVACVTKRPGGDPFEIAAFSLVALNEREI